MLGKRGAKCRQTYPALDDARQVAGLVLDDLRTD
jgi:hypothetical protein